MKYWDVSWSPVSGCSPCSPGCNNCWAKKMAYRLKGRYGYSADDPFRVTFHFEKAEQPLEWKKPKTVFVCLMGDLFHEDIKKDDRARIFRAMMAANWHTYLILTKRIQNALDYNLIFKNNPNWRLGVTVCNPDELWKIGELLKISALFRWVSLEPLLGDMDILKYIDPHSPHLNWVVGTESGLNRRPAKNEWIRSIVDQCGYGNIPCFVKQVEVEGRVSKNPDEWSDENIRIRKLPNAL